MIIDLRSDTITLPTLGMKEAMFNAYIENNEKPQIKLAHLIKASEQIVPLAVTMKTKIDGLREWASSRARPASADKEIEKIDVAKEETERKDLTKREKEEDIF